MQLAIAVTPGPSAEESSTTMDGKVVAVGVVLRREVDREIKGAGRIAWRRSSARYQARLAIPVEGMGSLLFAH